ncbi:MAG: TRAP transporter small permease [Chloroflexi bacterium]|nr:TRAP transporter small permease [Chloroflexota bacterium]
MFGRGFDRLLRYLSVILGGLIAYLVLGVTYEVIMRYVFNHPSQWSVDATEYSLLFILFLGSAWVLAGEAHVKVDILLVILPRRVQHVMNAVTSAIAAVGCALFFWQSVTQTWTAFVGKEFIWKSLILPKWPSWAVMSFGMLLLVIQFSRRAWRFAREQPEKELAEKLPDGVG